MLYCLIERLVLKSFGTSWTWNLLIAVPRLALSLAIALVVGLPMSQVIYSGSINDELSRTTTTRIHDATNEITRTYVRLEKLTDIRGSTDQSFVGTVFSDVLTYTSDELTEEMA